MGCERRRPAGATFHVQLGIIQFVCIRLITCTFDLKTNLNAICFVRSTLGKSTLWNIFHV